MSFFIFYDVAFKSYQMCNILHTGTKLSKKPVEHDVIGTRFY